MLPLVFASRWLKQSLLHSSFGGGPHTEAPRWFAHDMLVISQRKTGETPVTPSEPPRPTAPRGVRALGSSAPSGLPSHAGLHGVDTLSSRVALLGDAHMPLQPNALLFWGEGREVLRSSSPGRNIAEGRSGGSRGWSAHGWHEAHTAHAHTDPGRPPTATPRPYKAHTCVRSRTNSWATSRRNIRDPARGVSTESHSYSVVSPRAVLHSGEGDTRNFEGNRKPLTVAVSVLRAVHAPTPSRPRRVGRSGWHTPLHTQATLRFVRTHIVLAGRDPRSPCGEEGPPRGRKAKSQPFANTVPHRISGPPAPRGCGGACG